MTLPAPAATPATAATADVADTTAPAMLVAGANATNDNVVDRGAGVIEADFLAVADLPWVVVTVIGAVPEGEYKVVLEMEDDPVTCRNVALAVGVGRWRIVTETLADTDAVGAEMLLDAEAEPLGVPIEGVAAALDDAEPLQVAELVALRDLDDDVGTLLLREFNADALCVPSDRVALGETEGDTDMDVVLVNRTRHAGKTFNTRDGMTSVEFKTADDPMQQINPTPPLPNKKMMLRCVGPATVPFR